MIVIKSPKELKWEAKWAWLIGTNEILILINLIPSLFLYVLAIALACVYGTKYPEYETCRLLNSEDTYILRYFRTATIFDLAHPLLTIGFAFFGLFNSIRAWILLLYILYLVGLVVLNIVIFGGMGDSKCNNTLFYDMLLIHGAVSFAVVGVVLILVLVFSIIHCVRLRKTRMRTLLVDHRQPTPAQDKASGAFDESDNLRQEPADHEEEQDVSRPPADDLENIGNEKEEEPPVDPEEQAVLDEL